MHVMLRILSRQLMLFGVVGGLQVLLDWSMFVALTWLGLPVIAANLISRLSGACLGFWLNGRYTFASGGQHFLGRSQLRRFIVAWSLLTVLSTVLMVTVASHFDLRMAWLAKPAVEGFVAAIGFVVWKRYRKLQDEGV